MENQGIYLAKLNTLRENLYKNSQIKQKQTYLDSFINNRQSKLFNEIIKFDRVSSYHMMDKNLDENEKEFNTKIIQTQLVKPQTTKLTKKYTDSEVSSDTMSMSSGTNDITRSDTALSPLKSIKKLDQLGGGFNNSVTRVI